jgi:hypothetical protein
MANPEAVLTLVMLEEAIAKWEPAREASMTLRPWTVKQAVPWNNNVHRRLPRVQGGLWAVSVRHDGEIVGCAIVGHPARKLAEKGVLAVTRVAVLEHQPNACSMLYGSCSRAAKAMGAHGLVTYLHEDEHGASLKASNWIYDGMTDGGEHDRPSRRRARAVDAKPKQRWWAPWSDPALMQTRGQSAEGGR